jgi:hypothetical protein
VDGDGKRRQQEEQTEEKRSLDGHYRRYGGLGRTTLFLVSGCRLENWSDS